MGWGAPSLGFGVSWCCQEPGNRVCVVLAPWDGCPVLCHPPRHLLNGVQLQSEPVLALWQHQPCGWFCPIQHPCAEIPLTPEPHPTSWCWDPLSPMLHPCARIPLTREPHPGAQQCCGAGAVPGGTSLAPLSIGVNDHKGFTALPGPDWLRRRSGQTASLAPGNHPGTEAHRGQVAPAAPCAHDAGGHRADHRGAGGAADAGECLGQNECGWRP